MAHTEIKTFTFGKTLQIKAEVLKARLRDELHAQDEDYPYQAIVGITQVFYDKNVGKGEPVWELFEKGSDLGELFEQIEALEGQLNLEKAHGAKLERKLRSFGVSLGDSDSESSDVSSQSNGRSHDVSGESNDVRVESSGTSHESSDGSGEASLESNDVSSYPIRKQILSLLSDGAEKSTQEIIEAIDAHEVSIKAMLKKMHDAEEITRVRRGVYIRPCFVI